MTKLVLGTRQQHRSNGTGHTHSLGLYPDDEIRSGSTGSSMNVSSFRIKLGGTERPSAVLYQYLVQDSVVGSRLSWHGQPSQS